MKRQGQTLSLRNLTKSNVWDIQENDVFRLWAQAERDADLRDNERHYIDVIKSAFTIEEVKVNRGHKGEMGIEEEAYPTCDRPYMGEHSSRLST